MKETTIHWRHADSRSHEVGVADITADTDVEPKTCTDKRRQWKLNWTDSLHTIRRHMIAMKVKSQTNFKATYHISAYIHVLW